MKPSQFSFLGDEFENVFRFTDLFLPGIEKIAGIYYSSAAAKIRVLSRKRDEQVVDDYQDFPDKKESLVMIQKYRADALNINWIKKDDLPFDLPVRKPAVQNIFSELENVILVLKFPNESDGLNDLLIIYFNNNLGHFGLSRSDRVLSAENKSIIGYLLFHQFRSILQMNHNNKVLLQSLNQGVQSLIKENGSLKDMARQLQMNYSEAMVNMAQQILAELSAKNEQAYVLSEEAIEKVRSFRGNVRHLPAILTNAVIFTENLVMQNENDVTVIGDYSLDFDSYQVPSEKEQMTRRIDSRQSKAILLLDKLEKSASSLKSRSVPLTSAMVGKNLSPPITAPAITDALSKNKDILRQLLARYPEKWEIIRKEFKPLLNVLRKEVADIPEEESA